MANLDDSHPVASEDRLDQAIQAARSGRREEARRLLLAIVEEQEESEPAWLWLSSVVDNEADQRLCLENVLTLNPRNAAAQRHLAALDAPPPAAAPNDADPDPPALSPEAGYAPSAGPAYQDVWSSNRDLCAYCAHPIAPGDGRCPSCRRKLIGYRYRYPEASANLHIYWVLLLSLGQLFLVQLFIDLVRGAPDAKVIGDAVLVGLLCLLALAVYLRQFWAHVFSVGVVALITLTLGVEMLSAGAFAGILGSEAGRIAILADVANDWHSVANSPLVGLVLPFHLAASLFALFFGLFRTGPDFDRVKIFYAAGVDPALREATEFYNTGKVYAEHGMWASAVLYWQRAAALDPNRLAYPCAVAQGYAKLGFYERSLDLLQAARQIAASTATRADIEQLESEVRQRLAQQ